MIGLIDTIIRHAKPRQVLGIVAGATFVILLGLDIMAVGVESL